MNDYTLFYGDCLASMRGLASGLADSLITDPPAAIGFMGAAWDSDRGGRDRWIAWLAERLAEAKRIVKPGHYGAVWALPRRSHWTAQAIEDAGWVIVDRIAHLFGSGMPKSRDQLKPAMEDWYLIRAPGRGGRLNIDAARIAGELRPLRENTRSREPGLIYGKYPKGSRAAGETSAPRWPSHVVLQHSAACNGQCAPDCPIGLLDEQSGERPTGRGGGAGMGYSRRATGAPDPDRGYGDRGGASRFFTRLEAEEYDPFYYAAKASPAERDRYCEALDLVADYDTRTLRSEYRTDPRSPAGGYEHKESRPRRNYHPTVKSQKIMRWLLALAAPMGGTVFDPFMGSGSTGVACAESGRRFIGCELYPLLDRPVHPKHNPNYFFIASEKITGAYNPLRAMELAR